MGELKISIYSHQDAFIDLLYNSNREFEGQIMSPQITVNANGAKTCSFSIPLRIFDLRNNSYIDNPRWDYLANHYKIRIEKDDSIEEFVMNTYSESRDTSDKLLMEVNCVSLAEFELSQIGYNIEFSADNLRMFAPGVDPSDPESEQIGTYDAYINFWETALLANVPEWTFQVESFYENDPEIQTQRLSSKLYENNRIVSYDSNNEPVKATTYTEKQRIIEISKSNVWNIQQEICEKFECWPEFKITYSNGAILNKVIILKNEVLEDSLFTIRYSKNLKNITREVDNSQIVTKMYVNSLSNENVDDGVVTISNNDANYMRENYLLDLDWYLGTAQEEGITNQNLLDPNLSYTFAASNYAQPAISETVVMGPQNIIDQHKTYIRYRNLYIENRALTVSQLNADYIELCSEKEYKEANRDSAKEQYNQVANSYASCPQGTQLKEGTRCYAYTIEGETIVSFSEAGIFEEEILQVIKTNPTNLVFHNAIGYPDDTVVTNSNISYVHWEVCEYEPITKTVLKMKLNNVILGGAESYGCFEIDLKYHPLYFYECLKDYWYNKYTENQNRLDALGLTPEEGGVYDPNNIKLIMQAYHNWNLAKTDLYTAKLEKENVISVVESLFYPYIRDGYWEDTDYGVYTNQEEELHKQHPVETFYESVYQENPWTLDYFSFLVPNVYIGDYTIDDPDNPGTSLSETCNLYDIIDIDSIEVMTNDPATPSINNYFKNYVKGTDFTVEYGYTCPSVLNGDIYEPDTDHAVRGIYLNFGSTLTFKAQTWAISKDTKLFVRAKARGNDNYIYSAFLKPQYDNNRGTKTYFNTMERKLAITNSDVILSSIGVAVATARAAYNNNDLLNKIILPTVDSTTTNGITYSVIDNTLTITGTPTETFDIEIPLLNNYQMIDGEYTAAVNALSGIYINDLIDIVGLAQVGQERTIALDTGITNIIVDSGDVLNLPCFLDKIRLHFAAAQGAINCECNLQLVEGNFNNLTMPNFYANSEVELAETYFDLTYGQDYYTFKEIDADGTVHAYIQLYATTNAPLLTGEGLMIHHSWYNVIYNQDVTAKFYYNDALDVLDDFKKPQISYTLGIQDLSGAQHPDIDFTDYTLKVGTRVPIWDKEMHFDGISGFINSVTYDLLEPKNNSLTITTYKDKFEDLFQKITQATIAMQNKEYSYDRISNIIDTSNGGAIKIDILKQSLEEADAAISVSTNNDIVWDETGITITSQTENENGVLGQLRITSNGLFTANTIDPTTGKYNWTSAITPDFINADLIRAGHIDTRSIAVWNSSEPRFLWNSEGIHAYNMKNGLTDYNNFVLYNQDGLKFREYTEYNEEIAFNNLFTRTITEDYNSSYWKVISENFAPNILTSQLVTEGTLVSLQTLSAITPIKEIRYRYRTLDLYSGGLIKGNQYYYRIRFKYAGLPADSILSFAAGFTNNFSEIDLSTLTLDAEGFYNFSNLVTIDTNDGGAYYFELVATLSQYATNWSVSIAEPMIINITTSFNDTSIYGTPKDLLDQMPYFVGQSVSTYQELVPGTDLMVYQDAVELGWGGLRIAAQNNSVVLDANNGLKVLEKVSGILHDRLQLGMWSETVDGVLTKKYGLRGYGVNNALCFRLDDRGLWMEGAIVASSGSIAGWTINDSSLYRTINPIPGTSGNFNTIGKMYFGSEGISISNVFSVNHEGALTAMNATISGSIAASSGSIGGFTITSNSIYSGRNSLTSGAAGVYIGTDGISAGLNSTKFFKIASDGTITGQNVSIVGLTATSANISGSIDATTGTIGGFTITEDSIENMDGGYGIRLCWDVARASGDLLTILNTDERGLRIDKYGGTHVSGGSFDVNAIDINMNCSEFLVNGNPVSSVAVFG